MQEVLDRLLLMRHRRRQTTQVLRIALAVTVGAAGMSGCATKPVAVVEIGGRIITQAMVEHWVPIVAIRDYELIPRGPVPDWVVPRPPNYRACVLHLAGGARTGGKAQATHLKLDCKQQYEQLRQQVLEFLITGESLIRESELRGIRASPTQARKRFEMVVSSTFGGQKAFRRYVELTGETVADQMFRSKVKLASEGIERQFSRNGQSGARNWSLAFARWLEAFPRRWAARTNCKRGYVVANCKQYRGTATPRVVL